MDASCNTCAGKFPVARMDITENGYRCSGCSQQAGIKDHEQAAAQQLRDHNRAVTLLAGGKFWSIVFHCSQCENRLPHAPGIASVRLPPSSLTCAECGTVASVGFLHRANWMRALLFKFTIVASFAYCFATTTSDSLVATALMAFILAFIGSVILAIPLTFIVDRVRRAA